MLFPSTGLLPRKNLRGRGSKCGCYRANSVPLPVEDKVAEGRMSWGSEPHAHRFFTVREKMRRVRPIRRFCAFTSISNRLGWRLWLFRLFCGYMWCCSSSGA